MSLGSAKKLLGVDVSSSFTNINRLLHFSPVSMGFMIKAKKMIDPSIIHAKAERKKQRILRDIYKIQKQGRKLKPIDELILKPDIRKDIASNRRARKENGTNLSFEESERRYYLLKEYQVFVNKQHRDECWRVLHMMRKQELALRELKQESEELYRAALEPLPENFKQIYNGPLETPPIEKYLPLEGSYTDTTKSWDKDATATEFLVKKTSYKKKDTKESQEEMFLKQAKLIGDQKLIQSLTTAKKKK